LAILLAAKQKPRSPSEWEQRFEVWRQPASKTEDMKLSAAASRIRQALKDFLPARAWEIIPQGSYHNETNVRLNSDVDLNVCLTDAFFWDGPPGDRPTLYDLQLADSAVRPSGLSFASYRDELARHLRATFGRSLVDDQKKKALQLNADASDTIGVDVVPTWRFLQFPQRPYPVGTLPAQHVGVALLTSAGKLIISYPEQHYRNGCTKNARTRRRYKRTVRILKNLLIHMRENDALPKVVRDLTDEASSFLIESLVYNCDDGCLGRASLYDDVVAVLSHLRSRLPTPPIAAAIVGDLRQFTEVNGIQPLFPADRGPFPIDAAIFVAAAIAYMEI
jgi:hypothetical protein